jgi:penicillin-binding protein 1A
VTSLLKSVVEEGTGRAAKVLGRPIAGKTGTTNDYKDAWFAGYSTDFACVAWTGYDDNLTLGRGEAGAKAALPAFIGFMKSAHDGRVVTDFPVPQGIVRVAIDPKTGKLAHRDQEETIREYFLEGTEPTEVAGEDGDEEEEGNDADPPEPSSVAVLPPDQDAPPPF